MTQAHVDPAVLYPSISATHPKNYSPKATFPMRSSTNRKKKKQNAAQTVAEGPFFHGGCAGLEVGDLLLPPILHSGICLRRGAAEWQPNAVFVSPHKNLAYAYAYQFARKAPLVEGYAGSPLGSVYEVQPVTAKDQPLVHRDFRSLAQSMGGFFSFYFKAPVKVTEVIDTVNQSPHDEYTKLAPYETWAPTRESPGIHPIWTEDGYVQPNPTDAKNGIKWEHLQRQFNLGPYPGKERLIEVGLYIG